MPLQRTAFLLLTLGSLLLPRFAGAACTTPWTGGDPGTSVAVLEAEGGLITNPMRSYTVGGPSYSGAGYVSSTADNTGGGGGGTACGTAGCVAFSFTAPSNGDYKIAAAIYSSGPSDDSFFVEVATATDTCGNTGFRRFNTGTNAAYTEIYVNDNGTGAASEARVWTLASGTTYTITFKGRENGTCLDYIRIRRDPADSPGTPTFTRTPTTPPAPSATATAYPTVVAAAGLCGEYYSTMDLTGPSSLSTTGVSFDWGTGYPSGVGITDAETFSARWQGTIQFPWVGTYYLTLGGDDGVRMWLGSLTGTANYITNASWIDQGYTEYTGAAINITSSATASRAIRIEFYENTGDANVQLLWRNGVEIPTNVVVPQNRLSNGGSCIASTPTYTPFVTNTPTLTPTPVPTVWMGLPATERLYNLEYVPFPVVDAGGGDIFRDLSYPSSSSAGNDVAKNTARYRIVLQGLPVGTTALETRIGPFGVTCTTGYWNIDTFSSSTALTLPARPQNLSTTYAWVGSVVPITERYDMMGDPRLVPYADMLSLPSSQPFANNYNWFFKNVRGGADYQSEYDNFLTEADFDRYNGNVNSDVPRQMMLWREGIARTRSIYTSMTGFSNYYVGIGGEIGGDSANKLPSSVVASNQPWTSSSTTGNGGKNEITGAAVLVRMTGTADIDEGWISRPWLGELWPDAAYASDWASPQGITWTAIATWGNLRNPSHSGGFWRDSWTNCDIASAVAPGPKGSDFSTVRHITADPGCATFMNGNESSGDFGHSYNDGYVANWLYDAQMTANDYNFSVPNTFSVSRPFGLNRGNTPPENGRTPYSANRFTLDMYSASTQTATNTGYFHWDSVADQRSSAAVRGLWQGKVGWYIINGLAPSTDSGINFVARFAILSCLRTFHEAGAPAKSSDGVFNGHLVPGASEPGYDNIISGTSYRIEPIPWVKFTDPTVGQDLSGYSTVTLKWYKRYVRWDDQRYTENYPCLNAQTSFTSPCLPMATGAPGNPNSEWHSLTGTALVFNLKYSTDGGSSWKSCLTDTTAYPGVYMDTVDSISGNASNYYSYPWDVSGLAVGKKLVRVECYRRDIPLHYAFHEVAAETNP